MAFRIKKKVPLPTMKHVGTYALPSGSAISVHAEVGKPAIRWVYSQSLDTLKPEDLAQWTAVIEPTLADTLKKSVGKNRHGARKIKAMEEKTFRG